MKAVREILANDSNVTAVIAAANIWRNQPESTQVRPYIVIDTEDIIPSNQMRQPSNREEYRVKVSIFADLLTTDGSVKGSETIGGLCRTALEVFYNGGTIDGDVLSSVLFEDEFNDSLRINSQNAHMTVQEYTIILQR